jgi:hypothetical protein
MWERLYEAGVTELLNFNNFSLLMEEVSPLPVKLPSLTTAKVT